MHVGGSSEPAQDPSSNADDSAPSAASRPASSSTAARFPTGALVDGRYRIVGPIGAGGMGEVYRAEDEKLGVLVALKFLPASASSDAALRGRLVEEVRTARAVTHPNVCRVHDIGEFEDQLYLTMELVDGEDLGSLLRRIGRFPGDKAIELARQICAGLAAAHARGILHRDLKPANVMIDGEGRARITDFGLAIVGEAGGRDALAGTPLYMAPEQLEGREATVKSDVYALGLVLYELFTGQRPHAGKGIDELLRARRAGATQPATSLVRELDPVIEGLLERCLEVEPHARPASALVVAATLPGSDSLEARLAAGETPSPELIAAAGGTGALPPRVAGMLAALVVVLSLVLMWMNGRTSLVAYEDLPLAPAVLEHQARELLSALGFEDEPYDTAFGVGRNGRILRHIAGRSDAPERWDALGTIDAASAIVFWYRQASWWLDPNQPTGVVTFEDPPRTGYGSVTVILSPQGKLLHLESVAPPSVDADKADAKVDWSQLFAAAGIDPASEEFPLTPIEPVSVPPTPFDELLAWDTQHPDVPDMPLRVLAAGFQGQPVQFILDWDAQGPGAEQRPVQMVGRIVGELAQLVILIGAVILAWRSWHGGRADRRGALRLGSILFCSMMLAWVARVHAVPHPPSMFASFFAAVGNAAVLGLMAWSMYLALEGLVRRIWPRCLVAWSRLLNGGWRDPMVAQEVLVGIAVGSVVVVIPRGCGMLVPLFGRPPLEPEIVRWESLLSLRGMLGDLFISIPSGLLMGFGLVLLLVILRGLLRHRGLALGVLCVLMFVSAPIQITDVRLLDLAQRSVLTLLFLFLVLRYGVLAIAVAAIWMRLALRTPATFELGAWYGHAAAAFLALTILFAIYGYRVAAPAWATRARG